MSSDYKTLNFAIDVLCKSIFFVSSSGPDLISSTYDTSDKLKLESFRVFFVTQNIIPFDKGGLAYLCVLEPYINEISMN